jgi:hypothetical protein
MFQDEEGFMVTKMEMVSCSDDSEPEPVVVAPQKEVKAEPKSQAVSKSPSKKSADGGKKSGDSGKKTLTSAGKPKQASIMNFFQKK